LDLKGLPLYAFRIHKL